MKTAKEVCQAIEQSKLDKIDEIVAEITADIIRGHGTAEYCSHYENKDSYWGFTKALEVVYWHSVTRDDVMAKLASLGFKLERSKKILSNHTVKFEPNFTGIKRFFCKPNLIEVKEPFEADVITISACCGEKP